MDEGYGEFVEATPLPHLIVSRGKQSTVLVRPVSPDSHVSTVREDPDWRSSLSYDSMFSH